MTGTILGSIANRIGHALGHSAERASAPASGKLPSGKAVSLQDGGNILGAARHTARFAGGTVKLPDPEAARARRNAVCGTALVRPQVGPQGKPGISVIQMPGGGIMMTRPKAPIGEITFSGGGGKGTALPGAVQALQENGTLAQAKSFAGASVGSLTAACLAAGMSAETFTKLGQNTDMEKVIGDGRSIKWAATGGDPLSGRAFETLIRNQLRQSVHDRITDYARAGNTLSPEIAAIRDRHLQGGAVTFSDLRTLSRVIPQIKEVTISGTMFGDNADNMPGGAGAIKETKPQLAMFSADTEPDMDVAVAVHASAALPPVFAPVDITLSSGLTARFMDGGVMNNAPKSDTVNADISVDRFPATSKMVFVFGGAEADQIMSGDVKAKRAFGKIETMTRNQLGLGNYARMRALADRPDEVMVVPLKFPRTGWKQSVFGDSNYSGTLKGTLSFNMPASDGNKLQALTKTATQQYLARHGEPELHTFASAAEMLNTIPDADLDELVQAGCPGSAETRAFRTECATILNTLSASGAADGLASLDRAAGGDPERLAYLGRELARPERPALNGLLEGARRDAASPLRSFESLKQGMDVQSGQRARTLAFQVLRETVYPKMLGVDPKGTGGTVLYSVDAQLRSARTPDAVVDAIDKAIAHFATKPDDRGKHGHAAFASALTAFKAVVQRG